MPRIRHKILIFLVLILLMLPALNPLMSADFTCGYDNVFHLWRAVQVDALWSQGVFFSRWAPDMAQGYGFPLFVFTSPGPSMVAVLLHRAGLAYPQALNATFIIGIIIGGILMFILAEDLFGSSAGFVAAIAYVYAPFQAYDVFYRGSLWESFAWAFPPLVLWGIGRWAVHKQRAGLFWGVLGLALMVMSHHLFAFLFVPLFGVWVLAAAYRKRDWYVLWRGLLLGLLGMAITAFFWLPPLLERQFVQTERLTGTWVFDYRYNFISLKHLLALPRYADHLLINDLPEKALGVLPVLLAAGAFIGYRQFEDRKKWAVGVLTVMAVFSALLTLPVSRLIWDSIPLLRFVQFPWRFLGPAAFCTALLAGVACTVLIDALKMGQRGFIISFLLLSFIILGNIGWFFPKHCEPPGDISIRSMLQWEGITDTLGTTAKAEYLPVWVKQMPQSAPLQQAYNGGDPVKRLDIAMLPNGTEITREAYGALSDAIHINAADAFRIEWLRFYYPGWRVKIDDEVIPVFPSPHTGLLSFDIPAGSHSIAVDFIETPLRLAADAVSVAAVVAFVSILFFNHPPTFQVKSTPPVRAGLYFIFILILYLVTFLYAGREGSLWRRSRLREDGVIRGVSHWLQVNFGNKAMLLGADNIPAVTKGDDTADITLYWRALNPGSGDWQVGLSLAGPEGEIAQSIGNRPARWSRTPPPLAEWSRDKYARMDLVLDIPPGIPPGLYDLRLTLFDRDTLIPASVLGIDGNPVGPELSLGSLTINPPDNPYSLDDLGIRAGVKPVTCGPLLLWFMESDRTAAAPGDVVVLRWVWESAAQTTDDIRIPLRLVSPDGEELWIWDKPLIASWWSTQLWQQGDRWVGNLGLRIPGFVETGVYTISAGQDVCDSELGQTVEIIAPTRTWSVPEDYTPVQVDFGARLALKGVRLEEKKLRPGDVIELSLAWETLIQMDVSYRVYVHVTDIDGTLLVQNDGEPAGWTRPTTGWAVGEVVIDDRPMTIPVSAAPGSFNITVGVYTEGGPRLALPDGGDGVEIGNILIE
jgi:hypothetical protein